MPGESKHLSDSFDDLFRWKQASSNGTISLNNGVVRLDVTDGVSGYASIKNIYDIPQGEFILDIDIIDYDADAEGTSNALECFLRVDSSTAAYRFYIYYEHDDNGYTCHIAYRVNGGTITHTDYTDVGAEPSRLRIKRDGGTFYGYVYVDSWIFIGEYDFGSASSELYVIRLYAIGIGSRGGYIDFDNLIYVFGAYHYFLGPDADTLIEIFPKWDYQCGEMEDTVTLKTASGNLYKYKNYDYKQISFTVDYMTSSNAAIVNSWWDTQTKLIWQTEYNLDITNVDSVSIMNKSAPFKNNEYNMKYKGKIILEEYT